MLYIFLAGLFNGLMDSIQFRYRDSIFSCLLPIKSKLHQFFNPELSWKNKHKSNNKFVRLLMSTIFVHFTDAWHFFKLLMIIFIIFAVVTVEPIPITLIILVKYYLVFSIGFNLFYEFKQLKFMLRLLLDLLLFRSGKFGIVLSIFIYLFLFSIVYGILVY